MLKVILFSILTSIQCPDNEPGCIVQHMAVKNTKTYFMTLDQVNDSLKSNWSGAFIRNFHTDTLKVQLYKVC